MTDDEHSTSPADTPDWPHIASALGAHGPAAAATLAGTSPGAADRARMLAALAEVMQPPPVAAPTSAEVEAALAAVMARRDEAPRDEIAKAGEASRPAATLTPRRRFAYPLAAALAAAAVIAIVLARPHQDGRVSTASVSLVAARALATGIGQVDSLRLPDGTRVILGPSSSLDTAAAFSAGSREVTLHGMALFDVAHDAARPFTVRGGGAVLRDVGTSFVVHTDTPDGVVVDVREGAVAVRHAADPVSAERLLGAGDRGTLPGAGALQVARVGDVDLAWTHRRLVLNAASLGQVRESLRRWYGVELRVDDSAMMTRRVTASFGAESGAEAVRIIAATLGARVRMHGDTAILSRLTAQP